MPKKFTQEQERFIESVQQGLGVPVPPKPINEIQYNPMGELAYEMAKRKIAGNVDAPPPQNIKTHEDVQNYLEMIKRFPQLANQPANPPVLNDQSLTAAASSYRNPQYVAPDKREEAFKKILQDNIEDISAKRIRERQERGE